jgi:uncharacterized protein
MSEDQNYKESRYNHFITLENGAYLVFNAITCGLGEMNSNNYQKFKDLCKIKAPNNADTDDLMQDLKRGGLLIPRQAEELDGIKVNHYMARFGSHGYGLTLIPTFNCNFACDYCYEDRKLHSLPVSSDSFMSDKVCNNIISHCRKTIMEKTGLTITWYGGEPLLGKKVINNLTNMFLELCKEKQSQYHAGMITNGYLLDKENIDFLIWAKIGFVQITIDGPEDTHNMRRPLKTGSGTYRRILDNLGNIREDMPLGVSIRINIDNRNKQRIGLLLNDLKSMRLHQQKNVSIYFSQTIHYSNSCASVAGECMSSNEFSAWMVDAYKEALSMGFRISIYPATQMGTCGAVGKSSAVIEPDGYVQNCWNAAGNKSLRTGKLTENGIEYNYNYLKWLSWSPFREECAGCQILPLCMGGCPYKALYPEEVTDVENNTCVWWNYNLKPMLLIIKEAKEKGLLVVRNHRVKEEVKVESLSTAPPESNNQ